MMTYIDYCLKDEDTMLCVAMKYKHDPESNHVYTFDYTDTQERKLTQEEKENNKKILELGGRLSGKYETPYIPELHKKFDLFLEPANHENIIEGVMTFDIKPKK